MNKKLKLLDDIFEIIVVFLGVVMDVLIDVFCEIWSDN